MPGRCAAPSGYFRLIDAVRICIALAFDLLVAESLFCLGFFLQGRNSIDGVDRQAPVDKRIGESATARQKARVFFSSPGLRGAPLIVGLPFHARPTQRQGLTQKAAA
jgi:hypothetical protein